MRLLAGTLVAAVALAAPAAGQARTGWTTYSNDSIGQFDVASGPATQVNTSMLPGARTLAFTATGERYWLAASGGGVITGTTSPYTAESVTGLSGVGIHKIAVSPDGTRVYATGAGIGSGKLFVIDAATRAVVDSEIIGGSSGGVAVSPDGRRVYAGNSGFNEVWIYDVAAGSLLATPYTVGSNPSSMAITPDGGRLVTSNNGDSPGTASVVTLATGSVATVSGFANAPRDLAIDPAGRFAYVLNGNNPNLKVVDLAATPPAIVDEISWPTPPTGDATGIALTPDGSRAFVAKRLAPQLQVIDVATRSATGTRAVPGNPEDVAIFPNRGPRAAFTATPGAPGSPTRFDAGASRDPDGSIARYSWNFGDGTTVADGGASPSHTYAAPGTYNVTLTVTDDEGVSTQRVYTGQQFLRYGGPESRRTAPVTVAAPAGPAPPDGPGPSADPPRDTQPPKLTLRKPRNGKTYKRRTFRKLAGTALDQAPPGATAAGVGSVKVGLQKRVGKRCRPLRKNGKLGKARRCSKSAPLKARGTSAWSYKLRKRLPRGRYVLRVVATDRGGAVARTSVRFKLR